MIDKSINEFKIFGNYKFKGKNLSQNCDKCLCKNCVQNKLYEGCGCADCTGAPTQILEHEPELYGCPRFSPKEKI